MFSTLLVSAALCLGGDPDHLAKKLGHPVYAVREKNQALIVQTMDWSARARFKEAKFGDAEVTRRKELVIQAFEQKVHERLRPGYKVDLMGYPAYPWICEGFPDEYQWRGMKTDKIIKCYLGKVKPGLPAHLPPDFTSYRTATELWLGERIDFDLKDAICAATIEEDVHRSMKESMKAIHFEVKAMIWAEDRHWVNRVNPLRATQKKD